MSIFKSSFFCLAMWISTTLHNTPFDMTVHFTVWYTLCIPTVWILTGSTSLVILFINIIVSNTIYYIIEYCDYYNLTNCKDVPEIITILHNLLIKKWLFHICSSYFGISPSSFSWPHDTVDRCIVHYSLLNIRVLALAISKMN